MGPATAAVYHFYAGRTLCFSPPGARDVFAAALAGYRNGECAEMTSTDDAHDHPVDPDRVARAQQRLPSPDDVARLTGMLTLMADPVRLRVLYALDVAEELCVGDLALGVAANEDQVGYALRLLRTAGLVVTRKEGRVVFNRLADDFPEPFREHCLRQLVALTRSVVPDEADD